MLTVYYNNDGVIQSVRSDDVAFISEEEIKSIKVKDFDFGTNWKVENGVLVEIIIPVSEVVESTEEVVPNELIESTETTIAEEIL